MPLPAGVTTCAVTVSAPIDVTGAAQPLTVKITPSQSLLWVATGQIIESFEVAVAGGTIDLPHVDQAGFRNLAGEAITGWSYRVQRIVGVDNRHSEFSFQVFTGQTAVDLDLIPRGVSSVPAVTPMAVVTSVNGQIGAVVLDLDDAAAWDDITGKPATFPPSTHAHPTSDITGFNAAVDARIPALDADLTTIGGLDSTQSGVIASDGAGWLRKTYAALKTALGLVKSDVGLPNVDNTADTAKPVSTAQAAADAAVVASSAQRASNLSDLASASTARTNLGLGTAAVVNTGTGASDAILGNDARLTDTRTPTAHAASHASAGSDTLTLAESQVTNLTSDLAAKANVLTRTAVKTANYTAALWDLVPCDTSGGAFTLTLPAASGGKGRIAVKLVTAGNTLNLALTGADKFNATGGATTGTLTLTNQGILAESDGSGIWTVTADDIPLTGLDARYEAHDADLTTIAALTPTNDDVVQRKSGAWANRTILQLRTDIGITPAPYTPASDQWQNPANMVTATAGTPASGTVYLMPTDVGPGSLVVKGLGVNVSTAAVLGPATIVVTLGIYKDTGSGGLPDLTQLLGSGTVDPTTTGIKYVAFGSPITLTPGRYWAAVLYVATGTPTTAPVFTTLNSVVSTMPLAAATAPGQSARAHSITGMSALPTTSQTLVPHTSSAAPIVAIRAN